MHLSSHHLLVHNEVGAACWTDALHLASLAAISAAADIVPAAPAAGHSKWVWDCVFSVDAAYLVTASSDCTARLWDLSSGEAIRVYSGHHKVQFMCISQELMFHAARSQMAHVATRRYVRSRAEADGLSVAWSDWLSIELRNGQAVVDLHYPCLFSDALIRNTTRCYCNTVWSR